jgi:hypothetical protein
MQSQSKTFKHFLISGLLLVFLGLSISTFAKYSLQLLWLLLRLAWQIFEVIAIACKNSMVLLLVWVFILGVFKNVSMMKLVYKSLITILDNNV